MIRIITTVRKPHARTIPGAGKAGLAHHSLPFACPFSLQAVVFFFLSFKACYSRFSICCTDSGSERLTAHIPLWLSNRAGSSALRQNRGVPADREKMRFGPYGWDLMPTTLLIYVAGFRLRVVIPLYRGQRSTVLNMTSENTLSQENRKHT